MHAYHSNLESFSFLYRRSIDSFDQIPLSDHTARYYSRTIICIIYANSVGIYINLLGRRFHYTTVPG